MDAIATELGVDDGDGRVEWEFGQAVSQLPATLVAIRPMPGQQ